MFHAESSTNYFYLWKYLPLAKISDCIVIGGGVIGLSIARHLATIGQKIVLFERSVCGAEASWAGAGVISPCHPNRLDTMAQLRDRAVAVYPDFCKSLFEQTGIDPEYETCGELELIFTEEALNIARADAGASSDRAANSCEPDFILHTPDQLNKKEPAASIKALGALESKRSSQVRNPRLLQALKLSCEKLGVEIREHTPVIDFDLQDNQVTGVKTDKDSISSGTTILCAGAWSSQINQRLQEIMPVHPVRGQMVLMKLATRPFQRILSMGKNYLVPRRDGHVLLGATEEPGAGYTKRNTAKGVTRLIDAGILLSPLLKDANVIATWSGLRPGTPDEKPYLGPVPQMSGLIAATGHFRTGLMLAPTTAEIISTMIQNQQYDIDLTCCLPGREIQQVTSCDAPSK